METVRLGKTGREVSRIGFGGAPAGLENYLGRFDPKSAQDQAPFIEAIQKALEKGITYFDTAPGYGEGASERLFGRALRGHPRGNLFIASKVGAWKEQAVRPSLEKSLKNLDVAYLDLLQIHGTVFWPHQVDWILKPGGFLDQLEALRDEGLVRHIGITNEAENPAIHELVLSERFEVLQACYNFAFQHPWDPKWQCGSLYEAEKRSMGTVTMRSTTAGVFQKWIRSIRPEDDFDWHRALLQFQFSNPAVNVVLVGMRSPQEVEQNVAILEDHSGRVDIPALHDTKTHT